MSAHTGISLPPSLGASYPFWSIRDVNRDALPGKVIQRELNGHHPTEFQNAIVIDEIGLLPIESRKIGFVIGPRVAMQPPHVLAKVRRCSKLVDAGSVQASGMDCAGLMEAID